MYRWQQFKNEFLVSNGLNLQAIFNIEDLPYEIIASLKSSCTDIKKYSQIILIGHGGKMLWKAIQLSGIQSENRVDDFSTRIINQFFANNLSDNYYEIIYPGKGPVSLQKLGTLAGWHHHSPFMVGINEEWGTWFAYRAVVLTDTCFKFLAPSTPDEKASPCNWCYHKVCISNCPGGALDNGVLELKKCLFYRKQQLSECKDKCLSRISCPISFIHRYSDEQIRYHYLRSMKTIEKEY